MEKFKITKEGFKQLQAELEDLKANQRPEIISQIGQARELGDLKENADYHAAREKQGFIEAKIKDFDAKIMIVDVIDVSKINSNKIEFGATVKLLNIDNDKEVIYKIVSDYEANIEKGLISFQYPVAKALLGKEKLDEVDIRTPGGVTTYEVITVTYC